MRFFKSKRSAKSAFWLAQGLVAVATACGTSGSKPTTNQNGDSAYQTDESITACDTCGGNCSELTATITDRDHTTEPVDYPEQPPVGGPHNPCWLPWTIYTSEPQTERWVHNLEHGGLAFLYNCPSGCDADVATLTSFVQSLPQGRGIMLPYAEMDARFAVVAWGVSRTTSCVDTTALQAFYDAHVEHSPEDLTADPPASCPAP